MVQKIFYGKKMYKYASGLFLFMIIFSFGIPTAYTQSRCDKGARVTAKTTIWDQAPTFNLGKGWLMGRIIGSLKKDAKIFICDEKNIGFGVSTKRWYRIAYWGGSGWSYGWISSDAVQLLGAASFELRFTFGSSAYAEDFGSPPENVSPPALPKTDNEDASKAIKSLPDRLDLYLYAFIAMLLGMAAKIGFDISQSFEVGLLKKHIRRGLGALFVSPIVYLSILMGLGTALNIQENRTFIVFMILSFQNGFFWQNIFAGSEQVRSQPVKA